MVKTAVLQTAYFGPIQWYQKLHRYDRAIIEQHDSYQKQTYRNRCIIATANGLQALTVPVERLADGHEVKDLRISDHNQWRRTHWNALQSAYSESPFFEYYADDIRPFYERRIDYLIDFNEEIRQTVCQLIDISPAVEYSTAYLPADTAHDKTALTAVGDGSYDDFRQVIHAKHPMPDADFQPRRYWQVFERRHGFQSNLSILDLLFCMGPESVYYL